jgi:putative ABC transport system substrate-binding protein
MKRKITWLATSLLLFFFCIAEAQQPGRVPRIAFVPVAGNPNTRGPLVEAFRSGLRDLGYHEGKNIHIEYRYPTAQPDQVTALVNELMRLNLDVLVSSSSGALHAAKQTTKTIPIVMITAQDPVARGLVKTLAKPGGNITGIARLNSELSGKRLEIFKEVIPALSRVGILGTEGSTSLKDYEQPARVLNIQTQYLPIQQDRPEFQAAFQAALKGRVDALITVSNSFINRHRSQIVDFAIKSRLPSMFPVSGWVQSGGLLSYSADDTEIFRRAAIYVDKILKGAKPADLPVEQPTKFELVINLKTAKQIGLTIPPQVLARADRVIK